MQEHRPTHHSYFWGTSVHRTTLLVIQASLHCSQALAIFLTQGFFYAQMLNMFMPKVTLWLVDQYRYQILRNIHPQHREHFPTLYFIKNEAKVFWEIFKTWL